MGYVERWNELMPDIPLYSNFYYDVYNAKIENFQTSPFRGPAAALLYANVKERVDEEHEEGEDQKDYGHVAQSFQYIFAHIIPHF